MISTFACTLKKELKQQFDSKTLTQPLISKAQDV